MDDDYLMERSIEDLIACPPVTPRQVRYRKQREIIESARMRILEERKRLNRETKKLNKELDALPKW